MCFDTNPDHVRIRPTDGAGGKTDDRVGRLLYLRGLDVIEPYVAYVVKNERFNKLPSLKNPRPKKAGPRLKRAGPLSSYIDAFTVTTCFSSAPRACLRQTPRRSWR